MARRLLLLVASAAALEPSVDLTSLNRLVSLESYGLNTLDLRKWLGAAKPTPKKRPRRVIKPAAENYTQTYLTYLDRLELVDWRVGRSPRYLSLETNVRTRLATAATPELRDFLRRWAHLRRAGPLVQANATLRGRSPAPRASEVDGVLAPGAHALLREYYRAAIAADVFRFGDRQSDLRFYAHNESASRLLQYELLPLAEELSGVKLRPTYTYLAHYLSGAELPPHTDGPECAVSVSYVLDKPRGAGWPLRLSTRRAREKFLGGANDPVRKRDTVEMDVDANGAMLFSGTDHVHYRERLQERFYSVLLLHYCPAAGCDHDPHGGFAFGPPAEAEPPSPAPAKEGDCAHRDL